MPGKRKIKPCPFCGSCLEKETITDYANGDEVVIGYVHPMADCILSGFEVFEREIYQWNRRKSHDE